MATEQQCEAAAAATAAAKAFLCWKLKINQRKAHFLLSPVQSEKANPQGLTVLCHRHTKGDE